MRKERQIRTEVTGRERKEILMFTDLDLVWEKRESEKRKR